MRFAFRDRLPNERREVASPRFRARSPHFGACMLTAGRKAAGRVAFRVSHLDPALFERGKDSLHSFGLNSGFVFGNRGEYVNRELVRVGKIGSDEVESTFHQLRDHSDVAGKTIQAGDDKNRSHYSTHRQGHCELGAVVLPTANRLRKLRNEAPVTGSDVVAHRCTLCVDTEARFGLSACRDSVVSYKGWFRLEPSISDLPACRPWNCNDS
jgi:hypothetical protein